MIVRNKASLPEGGGSAERRDGGSCPDGHAAARIAFGVHPPTDPNAMIRQSRIIKANTAEKYKNKNKKYKVFGSVINYEL